MIPRENASASADASEAPNTVTMTHQEQLVDFGRQLDDIPNGVSLSTLLVQDARRRLVNNVQESERAPPVSSINDQRRNEQRPQATAQPPRAPGKFK